MLKDLLREIDTYPEGSSAWRKACGKLLWELGNGGYKEIFDSELLRRCLEVAERFKREDIIDGLKAHLREVEELFEKIEILIARFRSEPALSTAKGQAQPIDIVDSVLSSRLIVEGVGEGLSKDKLALEFMEAFWATHHVSSKDKEAITDLIRIRLAGEGVNGLFFSGGMGVVRKVYLYVSYNGSGSITCGNRAGEDLERAGRNGVAAALRYLEEEGFGENIRCDVHWQVEGITDEYEGSSVGLAVAVAVIENYLKHFGIVEKDMSRYAFTGEVELDGRIAEVGGIAAKARVAEKEGIDYMIYPSLCSKEIPQKLVRCKFLPCGNLREVVEALWGKIPKVGAIHELPLDSRTVLVLTGALIAIVAIVFLLWWLEAFSWAGVGMEGALLRMRGGSETDRVGAHGYMPIGLPITIVSIDDRSVKELGGYGLSWREHHSRLVDVLAGEEVRVIGFDICFEGDSQWDEEFANSLKKAKAMGVAVVLGIGCSVESGKPLLPPETIREAASGLGSIYLGQVWGVVRKAQVAIPQVEVQPDQPFRAIQVSAIPSFVLQLLAGGRVEDAMLNLKEGKLYSSSTQPIPVDREGYIHIDFAQGEFRRVSYVDALRRNFPPNFFRGRIALIGSEFKAHGKELDYYLTPRGRMYGVEIHAYTMGTILRGRYIRSLDSGPLRALWVGLWVSSMALISLRFNRWRFPVLAAHVIALGLISSYLFLSFDLLLEVVYPLVGMGLTFWWTGKIIAR